MRKLNLAGFDLLRERFEIELGSKQFVAWREGPEIYVSEKNRPEALGHIYMGSTCGGAIYLGQQCIAEFDKRGEEYIIRPVSNGRLDPRHQLKGDPLGYFFTRLEAVAAL